MLWDHSSKIIRVLFGPLEECDSSTMEAWSLLMGLRELNRMHIIGCMVKGDLKVVIS